MATNPGNGIYQTKSNWYRQANFSSNRDVYIQGNAVRLVNYVGYGDTERSYDVFGFDHFFEANVLGPRISDLPEGFDIRTSK